MKVLVTGATGFVGRAMLMHLQTQPQFQVRAAVRSSSLDRLAPGQAYVVVDSLRADTDWHTALQGMDAVVHLAARVHVMNEQESNPLLNFRQINVVGTVRPAQLAAAAGVRCMVYMRSAKVHGESTLPGQAFTETSPTTPQDAYGISKLETEQSMRSIAQTSGLELAILRPPLLYGDSVQANFAALARAVARSIPLPLGALRNQRSLIAVDNLVHLVSTCLAHPAAANQTFMANDGEDLSTTELIQGIAIAMNRPARLIPVPAWILTRSAALLGQQGAAQRLCGNLQVDIIKARTLLGWTPPVQVNEGLRRAVAGYRK